MWMIPRRQRRTANSARRITLEPLEDRCLLSFGTGGTVTTPIGPTGGGAARAGLVQPAPDGKIIAAGEVFVSSSDSQFGVARYNPDGTPDTTFNMTGKATVDIGKGIDIAHAVAVQADKKVVLGGQARRYLQGTTIRWDFALARFKADGTLDKSFNKTGKLTTKFADQSHSAVGTVLVQPDGKVVAVGNVNFLFGTGGSTWAVARYNADGSLDKSFDGDGLLIGPTGNVETGGGGALHQGKILVAGTTLAPDLTKWNFVLRRFNSNGTPDTTFGTGGVVTHSLNAFDNGAAQALVLPDDRIVVFGNSKNAVGDSDLALARYHPNGSIDVTFGSGGSVVYNASYFGAQYATGGFSGFATQADGKILVSGNLRSYTPSGAIDDSVVVRLNANGTPDTTFGTTGWVVSANAAGRYRGVAVQSDEKVVTFGDNSPQGPGFYLTRFNPDGSLDAGAALLAAGGPVTVGLRAEGLTDADLAPLVREAVARWQAAGADAALLASVRITIGDLGGAYLGWTSGSRITLDADAAGWGWFIDPTPADDSEFLTAGDQGEQGRIDLLTALMHEMGHALGLDHDEGVMQATLAAGTRAGVVEGPVAAIDRLFSSPADAPAFAPPFWGDVLGLLRKKAD